MEELVLLQRIKAIREETKKLEEQTRVVIQKTAQNLAQIEQLHNKKEQGNASTPYNQEFLQALNTELENIPLEDLALSDLHALLMMFTTQTERVQDHLQQRCCTK